LTISKESFDDHADHPLASNGPADGGEWGTREDLLGLSVQYPAAGVCVVTVDGELDTVSVPLFDACVAEQLAAAPAHLVLDLQPVSFLASTGLTSLLRARELAETTGTQLHLAGLVTRVVARALHVTELLECFDTYPTVIDALAVVTD